MTTTSLTLQGAGFAAAASLVLSSAGLTIALIAAASPPVSSFMTEAQNAAQATRLSWMWIVPAFMLVMGTWAMAQVVVRRPLLTSESTARRPVTNSTLGVVVFMVGVCVVLTIMGLMVSIGGMRNAAGGSVTDSTLFSGVGSSLTYPALPFAMLSFLLFQRWWQRTSV
jgi:hypothetical protein